MVPGSRWGNPPGRQIARRLARPAGGRQGPGRGPAASATRRKVSAAGVGVRVFAAIRLRDLGARIQKAVQGIPGLVDLSLEQQTDSPTVRVNFDVTLNVSIPL